MTDYNESDTRAKLIDPAIRERGWTEDLIRREETAPPVEIIDGIARRSRLGGRIDYTLRIRVAPNTQPLAVAVLEAKKANSSPALGLEQAKGYCRRLNVPFAISSNGHQFVLYEAGGATTEARPMSEFPTPAELRARYEQLKGFSLDSPAAQPLLVPYPDGEANRRYYQDAAIRATLERLAAGENRVLLSLATGAGKTRIAAYLLWKLSKTDQFTRALFVCDRDELRQQAVGSLQAYFKTNAAAVSSRDPQRNARILVATYQTLDVDTDQADANFLVKHYPPNFFSHIIIDECHRSAWGKWSLIFDRNPDAVQIGLTATPRQLDIKEDSSEAAADNKLKADNFKHFGEPVYEYSIGQGIDDGYLAACEIVRVEVFLDDHDKPEVETGVDQSDLVDKRLTDAVTGEALTIAEASARYEAASFEQRLILPERVREMCGHLFAQLDATSGPVQKTIIFCASDQHADSTATAINNLYAAWCAENGQTPLEVYAFKCTAKGGSDFLPDFKGSARTHIVACTVDLLSTGVDVPTVRNIVFFRYMRSPISFYQMVGRGTRIDIPTEKLMFRLYDYTNATRLFAEDFITRYEPRPEPTSQPDGASELDRLDELERSSQPLIEAQGFAVRTTDAGTFLLINKDGHIATVTVEEYRQMLAAKLVEVAPSLDDLRRQWVQRDLRLILLETLKSSGALPEVVQQVTAMLDYDMYDVLADLGYGAQPLRRVERAEAFNQKQRAWLANQPQAVAAVLRAIAAQFGYDGISTLESSQLFNTPELIKLNARRVLIQMGDPAEVMDELKQRIFAA